jgi:hypothetical protein
MGSWGGRSARHGEEKGELDGHVAVCGRPDGLLEAAAKGRRESDGERRGEEETKKRPEKRGKYRKGRSTDNRSLSEQQSLIPCEKILCCINMEVPLSIRMHMGPICIEASTACSLERYYRATEERITRRRGCT